MDTPKDMKNPVGRPTSYRPEYAEQAYKLCLLGYTDVGLADFFGVSEQTINAWKHNYPDFLESIHRGKDIADGDVVESLFKRAKGYTVKKQQVIQFQGEVTDIIEVDEYITPDTRAQMFWLKNRQAKTWREKQEIEHSGSMVVFDGEQDLKD